MGAKNFGRKKDSAKVKRAKRREKKLKALRFAGINVDVKEKDEVNFGETTMMTTDNDETEVSTTTPSKKEKRARDMRRKKELKLAMISMKEKRRKEEKKTSGTLRKTLSKNIQKMKKERDALVSKKKKKDADESEFNTKSVGEMNDVEMMTT